MAVWINWYRKNNLQYIR